MQTRGEEARSANREGKSTPTIAFSGGASRKTPVTLAWPLLVDGIELKTIIVRRLTGAQIAMATGWSRNELLALPWDELVLTYWEVIETNKEIAPNGQS